MKKSKTNEIVIYGTGGLGRGVIELIHSINLSTNNRWEIIGVVDDFNKSDIHKYSYLGGIKYLLEISDKINVVLAFGCPNVKHEKYKLLQKSKNIVFPNLVHPAVDVPETLSLGKGNIISSGVSLSADIYIGDFNLIHYNSTIGHDVRIENYNSIYPLSAISGYCHVNNKVEVGSNATVLPNKVIKDNCTIGAGSVVLTDIDKDSIVAGVPGEIIGRNEE